MFYLFSQGNSMIMLKRLPALLISFMIAVPVLVHGQAFEADGGPLGETLTNVIQFINTFIIPFIIGIGFLFFVWGMFLYFIKGGSNDDDKARGKSLLIYATAGFVLIFIFWGVVSLLAESTGLSAPEPTLELPGAAVPGR
jgi:hypothetical protein